MLPNTASCCIAVQKEYPLNHIAFFVFNEQENEFVFHFSKHGFAGDAIINGRKAGVSVYKYGKLYTAGRAVDFGCEYQGIILYGTIEILSDEADRMKAMKIFFQKFFSHVSPGSYEDFTTQDAKPVHVAKIKIESWFGKEHLVPELALDSFYPGIDPVII